MARHSILLASIWLAFQVSAADAHCSNRSPLRLTGFVYFLSGAVGEQRALVPDSNHRSGWLQLILENDSIRIANAYSGLALASDVYDLEVHVVDEAGRIDGRYPHQPEFFQNCQMLTLFPGQESKRLKLPLDPVGLPSSLRLRVRLRTNDR